MIFTATKLDGVYEISLRDFRDSRGRFIKTFNAELFEKHGLKSDFKESFYNISNKNVIRGMHFQMPPADHAKLVTVMSGAVTDVVLDLRKQSSTYGEFISVRLDANSPCALYMPSGVAHGFIAHQDNSVVNYMTTSLYNPRFDSGISWDSFGFDWQATPPVISERDQELTRFSDFDSPF